MGFVFRQKLHPLGSQPAVPDRNQMGGLEKGLHLAQHPNETIDRIRRLPCRGTQLPYRVKRAIGISMSVYDEKPFRHDSSARQNVKPPNSICKSSFVTVWPSNEITAHDVY
jgi:hypothetical protein